MTNPFVSEHEVFTFEIYIWKTHKIQIAMTSIVSENANFMLGERKKTNNDKIWCTILRLSECEKNNISAVFDPTQTVSYKHVQAYRK